MYELDEFKMIFLVLFTTVLMAIYFVYIEAKVRFNSYTRVFLKIHAFLIVWSLFFLLQNMIQQKEIDAISLVIQNIVICMATYYNMLFVQSFYSEKKISPVIKSAFGFIPIMAGLFSSLSIIFPNWEYSRKGMFFASLALLLYVFGGILSYIRGMLRINEKIIVYQTMYYFSAIFLVFMCTAVLFFNNTGKQIIILNALLPGYLVFLIWITIKHQLYEQLPFVFDSILDNSGYGIIIFDNNLKLVDYNRNFLSRYIDMEQILDLKGLIQKLEQVCQNRLSVENFKEAAENIEENYISGELTVTNKEIISNLNYSVMGLLDSNKNKMGTLVTIRDMTTTIQIQLDLQNKNQELIQANEKLKEHIGKIHELEIEKERNALMEEISDTFGHSMTEILALLEVGGILLEKKETEALIINNIEETILRSRNALTQMREAVSRYNKNSDCREIAAEKIKGIF